MTDHYCLLQSERCLECQVCSRSTTDHHRDPMMPVVVGVYRLYTRSAIWFSNFIQAFKQWQDFIGFNPGVCLLVGNLVFGAYLANEPISKRCVCSEHHSSILHPPTCLTSLFNSSKDNKTHCQKQHFIQRKRSATKSCSASPSALLQPEHCSSYALCALGWRSFKRSTSAV
jgi:hypothetical protein